jgi:hypothetical protein
MCSCAIDLDSTYCTIDGPVEYIVGGIERGSIEVDSVERNDEHEDKFDAVKKKILLPYYYEVLNDKKKGNERKTGGGESLIEYINNAANDDLVLWNYRNIWMKTSSYR